MDSDWVWALMGIGGALWQIGGAGPKWARRELWPAVIAALAIYYGMPWWSALITFAVMDGVHRIGYSPSDTSWVARAGIALLYGFSLIMLTGWTVATAAAFTILLTWLPAFWISSKWNKFTWKWVEFVPGFWQGFWVAWFFVG